MKFKESDLTPLYKEMAELIGIEETMKLYHHFKWQQVLFPQRIYSLEFIKNYVREHYDGKMQENREGSLDIRRGESDNSWQKKSRKRG